MTNPAKNPDQTSNRVVPLPVAPAPKNSLAAALENARREAVSLADATDYPMLLLPVLQEEIEQRARTYWDRQLRVQAASARILEVSLGETLRSRAA